MIKALALVPYHFLPAKVGGQKGIALFYQYFSRQAEVCCVTTQNNDPAAAEGYVVENILSNSALRYVNIFYFFTLRKKIREKKITHLILEHPYYGWLGLLLKWTTSVKLVVHSHNIEGLRWKNLGKWWWKILWQYEKWVHKLADHSFFIQENDRQYAIDRFGVSPARCAVATYGIGWNEAPSSEEKQKWRQWLQQQHGIPANHQLLLFNGAFDYFPNLEALEHIIHKINPLLQQQHQDYTILLCGRNIPESISSAPIPNMIIPGFVDDINPYFRGSDLFLNPVTSGGGIKTKLVEALGNGMNAVSAITGAEGVDPDICGGKLILAEDNQWQQFVNGIIALKNNREPIPASFFRHFYWGTITEEAARALDRS